MLGNRHHEDLLLESALLRRQPETTALAFTELMTLDEHIFKELVKDTKTSQRHGCASTELVVLEFAGILPP